MTVKELPPVEYVVNIAPIVGATAAYGFAREGTAAPNLLRDLGVATETAKAVDLAPAPDGSIDRLIDWALSQEPDPDRGARIKREAWGADARE